MAFNIIKIIIYMHVWFREIQSKTRATNKNSFSILKHIFVFFRNLGKIMEDRLSLK